MIYVTKTYLPNKNNYKGYIDKIYENGWITNNGPLVNELSKRLSEYLGVENLVLVANGTVALEIAYRTLDLKGFAITTPFSFVATTSSLVTNSLLPVFADIDQDTLNMDPENIEKLITKNTSAIVPVHVFGNPCDIEGIDKVAQKHDLKVVYDAAHAFGVKYKDTNILNYGDISVISFHATKLFHTVEGGALIIKNKKLVEKAKYLINFGIENAESIPELGTNAKMNEFEAAMGLCLLDDMDLIIEKRKKINDEYCIHLKDRVKLQEKNASGSENYAYFPIILEDENQLKRVQKALNDKDIFPRRYFYPSLDTLPYIEPKQHCKNSRDIASRILCLPIYPELKPDEQNSIIETVLNTLK